jgi:hypothetical protein
MFRSYIYTDGAGKEFHVRVEIDEDSKAWNRMVNRMANRARGSKRKTATLGDGAIQVKLVEVK